MSILKQEEVRVFARQMARELLPSEIDQISGGADSFCGLNDTDTRDFLEPKCPNMGRADDCAEVLMP